MDSLYYTKTEKQQAEGSAWIFTTPESQGELYYYLFKQLDSNSIRIKVRFIGLSRSDRVAFNNSDGNAVVPGTQAFGQVVAIGSNVGRFRVGDRVGAGFIKSNCGNCNSCHRGLQHLCKNANTKNQSVRNFGNYSTYIDINSNWAFNIPNSIPDQSVAPLLADGVAIYRALRQHSKQNFQVGILGFNSLGNLALRLAKSFGLRNITVVSQSKRSQEIQKQGVKFLEISDLAKVHFRFHLLLVCLPQLTSDQFQQAIYATKTGYKLVLIGTPYIPKAQLGFFTIVAQQRQIIGCQSGSRADHFEFLKFAAKHKIHPQVELIQFNQIGQNFGRVLKGEQRIHIVAKI